MDGPFPSAQQVEVRYAFQTPEVFSWFPSRQVERSFSSRAAFLPWSWSARLVGPATASHWLQDVAVLCADPFRSPSGVFGCGQCMPCRINRRRMWTARIVLEAGLHEYNCFATLTLRDRSHFFLKVRPRELNPYHLRVFLKELRRLRAPHLVRYYGVGEYGDINWRPHYHLALFGVGMMEQPIIERAWPHGHVHVGELTTDSAHYIAGYVTKKMTAPDDPRLRGLHPEFCRMSLKPGIGRNQAKVLAKSLMQEGASHALVQTGDVPHEVRVDGKKYPLGRYIRRELRDEVGWSKEVPERIKIETAVRESLLPDEDRWAREEKRALSERSAEARAKIGASKRQL